MCEWLDFRSWWPKNYIPVRAPPSQNSWPLSSSPWQQAGSSSLTCLQQRLTLSAGYCDIVELCRQGRLANLHDDDFKVTIRKLELMLTY